jgi:hypothetical protein
MQHAFGFEFKQPGVSATGRTFADIKESQPGGMGRRRSRSLRAFGATIRLSICPNGGDLYETQAPLGMGATQPLDSRGGARLGRPRSRIGRVHGSSAVLRIAERDSPSPWGGGGGRPSRGPTGPQLFLRATEPPFFFFYYLVLFFFFSYFFFIFFFFFHFFLFFIFLLFFFPFYFFFFFFLFYFLLFFLFFFFFPFFFLFFFFILFTPDAQRVREKSTMAPT